MWMFGKHTLHKADQQLCLTTSHHLAGLIQSDKTYFNSFKGFRVGLGTTGLTPGCASRSAADFCAFSAQELWVVTAPLFATHNDNITNNLKQWVTDVFTFSEIVNSSQ